MEKGNIFRTTSRPFPLKLYLRREYAGPAQKYWLQYWQEMLIPIFEKKGQRKENESKIRNKNAGKPVLLEQNKIGPWPCILFDTQRP